MGRTVAENRRALETLVAWLILSFAMQYFWSKMELLAHLIPS